MATEWVALLRGVNVGGITIRSADLAAAFRALPVDAVKTYLASGNVRFTSSDAASDRAALKSRIEAALRARFGYDAWIVLVTLAELRRAIAGFPFDAADAGRQPWVLFCSDTATRDELAAAAVGLDENADPVASVDGVIYWNPVKGTTTDTAFAKILARAKYKATSTNRNLRTLIKIAQ